MTARERVSTAETAASVAGTSERLGGGPEDSSGSTRGESTVEGSAPSPSRVIAGTPPLPRLEVQRDVPGVEFSSGPGRTGWAVPSRARRGAGRGRQ